MIPAVLYPRHTSVYEIWQGGYNIPHYSFRPFRLDVRVCVCVCVCLCVDFLLSKITAAPRILKFGTNVGYDLLYCGKKNQPASCSWFFPLCVYFSFSPIKYSVTEYQSVRARAFKFYTLYTYWEWRSIIWERQPKCFFVHFSISLSNVIPYVSAYSSFISIFLSL